MSSETHTNNNNKQKKCKVELRFYHFFGWIFKNADDNTPIDVKQTFLKA